MSLEQALLRLEKNVSTRAKSSPTVPVPEALEPGQAGPVQLPVWPDATRGLPNAALRSALFSVQQKGPRKFLQAVHISSVASVSVLFTGPRLDQSDLDVWEECLHRARRVALGAPIQFKEREFLISIGRATGGKNVEWLRNVFRRLAASVVEISDGTRAYLGQLIKGCTRDEKTGLCVIAINPDIAALYCADGWTQTNVEHRRALKGQPIAQWLHGFYSTHAEPYPIKVETLYLLCGSCATELKHFRSDLRASLAKLAVVAGWGWKIDKADLVHVETAPTASQRRHLARAQAGARKT